MSAIPRSTYYYRPLTREKKKADADLRDRIEQIALEFPRYGYRRVTHQLKREGLCVNHKRVLRVMRASSLLVAAKKGWRKTTDSNHPFPVYPDLTKELTLDTINQLWEEVYLCEYQNSADVRKRIPCFLETLYNKKRLHSSLG